MDLIVEKQRETKIRMRTDVVVVGGGPAGITAAIASARQGVETVLIEKDFCLGSNITLGPLEAIMTFHDSTSQIIQGIPQEIIDLVKEKGGSPGHVPDTVGYCSTITPFDPEIFKAAVLELLEGAGVTLLLQTMLVDVVREGGRVKGVIVESKSGREAILASQFVDCSGDGDLCVRAGADFEAGRPQDGLMQPMTLLFKMGGVDVSALREYVGDHLSQFKLSQSEDSPLNCDILHLWGFGDLLSKGFQCGSLSLKRRELHMITTGRSGEVIINFTRADGDGTDAGDVTAAYLKTMRQAQELSRYLQRYLPPFRNAYILFTGKVGVRETRRILGKYLLKENDVLNQTEFPDTVAHGAFPIDIHQPGSDSLSFEMVTKAYSIPLRCLTVKNFDNLLVAGRCISVDSKALASVRISASCMATGQAAGVTAALAAKQKKDPLGISVEEIVGQLEKR